MYKFGTYVNFDKLIIINNKLFDYTINNNIRDFSIIESVEAKLASLNKEKKLNEELLLNVVASILCMQPFFDGNSRTLKIYMHIYLEQFNKHLETKENIIPIFFSPDEKCSKKDINEFRKKF